MAHLGWQRRRTTQSERRKECPQNKPAVRTRDSFTKILQKTKLGIWVLNLDATESPVHSEYLCKERRQTLVGCDLAMWDVGCVKQTRKPRL